MVTVFISYTHGVNEVASRPELIQIAQELKIDWQGLSIQELKMEIRKVADKKLAGKRPHYKADPLSKELKKFLTEEYDFVVRDKNGKEVKI